MNSDNTARKITLLLLTQKITKHLVRIVRDEYPEILARAIKETFREDIKDGHQG